jgi:hypothetical protein
MAAEAAERQRFHGIGRSRPDQVFFEDVDLVSPGDYYR